MEKYRYFIKGTLNGSIDGNNGSETLAAEDLLDYLEDIQALFTRDPDAELAQYILKENELAVVEEIWVDVKEIGGKLYSWTEVTTSKELDEEAEGRLIDYLTGQFSDGYGESLEQREFRTKLETVEYEEYDLETENYYTEEVEEEFYYHLYLWQHDGFKLEFADPEELEVESNTKSKPRCNLIGEDGNIFNLVGIASRCLSNHGLKDEAKEMRDKVFASSSYSEALAIIADYVEVR